MVKSLIEGSAFHTYILLAAKHNVYFYQKRKSFEYLNKKLLSLQFQI